MEVLLLLLMMMQNVSCRHGIETVKCSCILLPLLYLSTMNCPSLV